MQIVITHAMADFDALAAAVAATKVYPGARTVLPPTLGRDVRAYLALHRDALPVIEAKTLDVAAVTRLVVVDVRRMSRLGAHGALIDRVLARDPSLEVHVYDHHAASEDDLPATHAVVERVGSATTLLIELMQARSIRLDPVEATLLALGIHVDTGSLSFGTSTSRDAAALAFAMDHGASLAVLGRYLAMPFTEAQRVLLRDALAAVRVTSFGAARIAFVAIAREHGVEGIDEVASEILGLHDVHALFLLVRVGTRRVQVVARARASLVDVGTIARRLGGGGHPTAASAMVKHGDADATETAIRDALAADPPRPRSVAELMTSPATATRPDRPFGEIAPMLARLHGLPVVDDGRLVGIVSRRDLARAEREKLLHRPVASSMTRDVITICMDASLEDARNVMERHDVGRLPVLRDGQLVGVIARSDVLEADYGNVPA